MVFPMNIAISPFATLSTNLRPPTGGQHAAFQQRSVVPCALTTSRESLEIYGGKKPEIWGNDSQNGDLQGKSSKE